jgi:hypothetical protein
MGGFSSPITQGDSDMPGCEKRYLGLHDPHANAFDNHTPTSLSHLECVIMC